MTQGQTTPAQNPLVEFLDRAINSRGWTREGLAKRAGLSRDMVRSLENRGPRATVNMATILKLANALEIDPNVLIAAMPFQKGPPPKTIERQIGGERPHDLTSVTPGPRDVPVLGTAAGSSAGAFQLTTEVIEYVRRPPALATTQGAYALYVENDSMVPRFWPGDLIFVHPHRPLAIDDVMVVQTKPNATAPMESFIKVFKGRTSEWLLGEQYNPKANVRYKRDTIIAAHKVLSTAEMFGL